MHTPLTVVVPNWNGIDFIEDCLTSLLSQSVESKIIVVDNGSIDGSNTLVKEKFPQVELIQLDKNYGFAGGVNRGIEKAIYDGGEFIALLNNDAVAHEDWLKNLVATIKANPQTGMVTSKIKRSEGNLLDSTGDFYSIWGFPYPRGRDEEDIGQYDDKKEVFGCSGGATLYRADMLKRIGFFDEDFFAYFEDVDISFRAQLAGWKALYEPSAVVTHYVGGTSSKLSGFARYHTVKNFVYLYTKNMPRSLYWKYLWRAGLAFAMMAVSDIKRGQVKPYLKGASVALLHLPSMLKMRYQIQSRRSVSVEYIDSILVHEMPPTQKAYLNFVKKIRGSKV